MANESGQVAAKPVPVPRRFKFRTNAKAGINGAFNGVCVTKEGHEWLKTIHPIMRPKRGPDGKKIGGEELIFPALPTWADVIEEYEVPKPEKPIRRIETGIKV